MAFEAAVAGEAPGDVGATVAADVDSPPAVGATGLVPTELGALGPFDSSSATRFSSCSMRSSIHCSRSVKPGAGASGLEAVLAVESFSLAVSRALSGVPSAPNEAALITKRTAIANNVVRPNKLRIDFPLAKSGNEFSGNGSGSLPSVV